MSLLMLWSVPLGLVSSGKVVMDSLICIERVLLFWVISGAGSAASAVMVTKRRLWVLLDQVKRLAKPESGNIAKVCKYC